MGPGLGAGENKDKKKGVEVGDWVGSLFLVRKRSASSKPCRQMREQTSGEGGKRMTTMRHAFWVVNWMLVPQKSKPNKLKEQGKLL
jgi:hypothetical protein